MMQTTLNALENDPDGGRKQLGLPPSPEQVFRATRPSIEPAKTGHEIQQRHQVSESRNHEVVVQDLSGSATGWPCGPQLQQLQQPPQRQLQLQPFDPLRNGYDPLKGVDVGKKTHKNLYPRLCEYENLLMAEQKARKRKSGKVYVKEFEKNLQTELSALRWELLTGTYQPRPLKTFTIKDPKTRKISASNYRDRVVHHAICNLLEPIFESRFIFDTYTNRKGKGTKAALERFDMFMRKNPRGYALKADIYHYFESIDQQVLLKILSRRIKDKEMLGLISLILKNHKTTQAGKGMPLGNLTSQFLAGVYLGELDNFVKHNLRAKYYLRYVDDFIIVAKNKEQLEEWKNKIGVFLQNELLLKLHPAKTRIVPLSSGVGLVGFRVFHKYKLLKKSNIRRVFSRLDRFGEGVKTGKITKEKVRNSMAGWSGYAKQGNTYKLRNRINERINSIC